MNTLDPTVVPYFLYSFGILFREGLEAMLVIVALLAGVREADAPDQTRNIYVGAIAAIVISAILAWAVSHVLGDNTSDTLEGVFQIFAAATLFYVSSWLTSKTQAKQWNRFISSQVAKAKRSAAPALALGLTAFLAVMREGAETIVFFQALLSGATETAEKHAVTAGVAGGAIALLAIFALLRTAINRIPIGSFFRVTSLLLYAMAVIFVGQGVASWQESGLISATSVSHVPSIAVLGLHPTVQTLAAQGVLLLLAALAIVPLGKRRRLPPATMGDDQFEPAVAEAQAPARRRANG